MKRAAPSLLVLALLLLAAVPALAGGGASRWKPDKSAAPALPPETPVARIVVKFAEGTHVRLRDGVLTTPPRDPREQGRMAALGLSERALATDLSAIQRIAARDARLGGVRRRFQLDEGLLAELKQAGEARSGGELADLDLFYELTLPAGTAAGEVEEVVAALNALPSVEIAYAEPFPQAASVDLPPATPSFESLQGYLDPAPGGIDARYAWTQPGGKGQGVRIVDVEQGWRVDHEDFPALFHTGGFNSAMPENVKHGTAVLGELAAPDNGYGITGIANLAQIGYESALRNGEGGGSYDVATAIVQAALFGDVVLVEQQEPGPENNYVPMEWSLDSFEAIRTATANGTIVVEAGGNGRVNLDSPVYAGAFDRSQRDSGALLVGASLADGATPADFTNWGTRVDLHAWGEQVETLGYGDQFEPALDPRQAYTSIFNGTSSASPMVAGAAAILLSYAAAHGLPAVTPQRARQVLVQTGTPQTPSGSPPPVKSIGPQPDLRAALALLSDQPPSPAFTFHCSARTCSFDAGGSTDDHGVVGYAWDFGDGSTGVGRTIAHTFASAGAFPVALTVNDTAGQESSTTHAVTTVLEFTLSVSPSTATIPAEGGAATYTVTLARQAGFTDPVTLSVSGLPFEATASFSPNPATGSSSTLTIEVTAQTLKGTSPLTLAGTSPGLTFPQTASATLVNNLSCTFAFTPPSASISGSAGTYTVAVAVGPGCHWRVANDTDWISIFSGSTGAGAGSVTYSVAQNPGSKPRIGTFLIGTAPFQVTQAVFANSLPSISSISPVNVTVGDPGLTLAVFGANFVAGSVVRVDGQDRPTTFNRSSWLNATLPPADLATAGSRAITVFTPAPGGGTSNAATLTVNPNPNHPVPSIGAVSPPSVTAGGPDFTLTIDGAGFYFGSVARINGLSRTTTFVSSIRLTAVIRSTDIAKAGSYPITVFNPTPGGGTSNAVNLTVTPGAACTYSIAPASASIGAGPASGNLAVTTQAGCAWTAVSHASWITITSGASGTGSGSVFLSAGANPAPSPRTGTVTVASSQTFTVTQAAAATGVPATPVGLTASALSASQIRLAWTDASSNETSFSIERMAGNGSFAQVATVGANATTYTDAKLASGTTYVYRVRACNASGCSAYSNVSSVSL